MENTENKSFEEALGELEKIVRDLELGKDTLEESIRKYQKAHILKNFCISKLNNAKLSIEKISQSIDGEIKVSKDDELI